MGRTTFEPALEAERWPWPDLDVFVFASERPAGTPEHVTTDNNPTRLPIPEPATGMSAGAVALEFRPSYRLRSATT